MRNRIKILFVCTVNRMRSRTAEKLYKNDERFEVKSAGVSFFAKRTIDHSVLSWADYIVVMEDMHVREIRNRFPDLYHNKRVICLDIPDIYIYMDPKLQKVLKTKFEKVYREEIVSR